MLEDSVLKELLIGLDIYIHKNLIRASFDYDCCCCLDPYAEKNNFSCDDISHKVSLKKNKTLDDLINHVNDTFQESMFYHINTKGLNVVEVYENAHLDRKLFSKIKNNKNYTPSKITAICICFGLKLNLDETIDLLEKAGYTLSHSSVRDIIIEYLIENKVYDLVTVNTILFDYCNEILYE